MSQPLAAMHQNLGKYGQKGKVVSALDAHGIKE